MTSAIAMTRLPEAFDFLIQEVERESRYAVAAVEALGRIGRVRVRARIERAVEATGSERLRNVFKHFAFQEHSHGRSRNGIRADFSTAICT